MQPIRRILVAIKDPAARALPAVHKAAQIAKGLGAQLTLFHDIATPLYAETWQRREVDLRSWQREVQTARREQLEKLARRIRKHDIDVDVAADWDYPPYEAIIRKAQRVSADLVVIENRHGAGQGAGQGAGRHPARWLLSYTDWELLRLCPMPVLLVKNRKLYHRPRVLAAVDPAHHYAKPAALDRQILRAGAQLVHALHGELHAIHAFAPPVPLAPAMPDGPLADIGESYAALERLAKKQLARAVDGFEVKPSHRHVVEGRPNEAIPRTAKRERSAIVAMGVVSRSGLKRFFIGNTAEFVMDAVTADILVVKGADFPSRVPRAGRGVQVVALPILPG
ncbi:MAG TPA: universal stress protein [Steroidobacteraceae bacterium]|nr:universal stress protein [Steroidobacteraceae bacterium]